MQIQQLIQDFKTKRLGNRYQESAQFWYQCVAEAKLFVKECFWISLWRFWTAYNGFQNVYNTFSTDKRVRIDDRKQGQAGDLIFFAPTVSNKAWHIAVVSFVTQDNYSYLEQNWWRGSGDWLTNDAIRESIIDKSSPKILWFRRLKSENIEPTQDPIVKKTIELWIWSWTRPWDTATREEVAIMIWRALNL